MRSFVKIVALNLDSLVYMCQLFFDQVGKWDVEIGSQDWHAGQGRLLVL